MESEIRPLGRAHQLESPDDVIRFQTNEARIEVTVLAPDLFRVGMFPRGEPVDYSSEAVAKANWPAVETRRERSDQSVRVDTAAAGVQIDLDPLRLRFHDAAGRAFAEDDPDVGMGVVRGQASGPGFMVPGMRLSKRRPPGERYFGCGERSSGLDKTDSRQVFWNVDPLPGHSPAHLNLYSSIPFVVALEAGRAWGLFLDNPGRTEFDLAHERPDRLSVSAERNLVYYLFAGPTPAAVLERYTELTGRTPMPPLWSLGNNQSRWGYRTAEQVRGIAAEFRRRDIPCDVIHLDIDYMDGYRVFTWNPDRFPDPQGLLSDLEKQGFHVVTIVDPGVKVDPEYAVYCEGQEADLFCKTEGGEEYHNVVWPGVCAFPDFTNPRTRDWWAGKHAALTDAGVAGIWCDMNEPSVFIPSFGTFPPDLVHPGGGNPRRHADVHNLYGMLMARAAREGLLRLHPDRRPVVISRSGFAGLQRYALQWTGDNSSWWEHLWMAMPQLQNMGLSGLSWAGVDVGGFAGPSNGELLTRWTEFGIFQPFCRNHSMDARDQEPWQFGPEWEAHIRSLLKLRQRLLPYLYAAFEECHRTGAPILRPLLFEFPEDETTFHLDDEFMVGSALLVAPISRPGTEYRHVYLPAGVWCHLWSNQRIQGPAHILAHVPYGKPAVYVRANRAIPLWPEMSYVGERPADPLTLLLFPDEGEGEVTLYEDAGDGFEYQQGAFSRRRAICERRGHAVTVTLHRSEGSFKPERARLELELRGVTAPRAVTVNGRPVELPKENATGAIVVAIEESQDLITVKVELNRSDTP